MKNIICLFVVCLISNAVNAADKWEYVLLTSTTMKPLSSFTLSYPDGKKDIWKKGNDKNQLTIPPKGFQAFFKKCQTSGGNAEKEEFDAMIQKDFSQRINVVNALGLCGFEMSGNTVLQHSTVVVQDFWFKRKISK